MNYSGEKISVRETRVLLKWYSIPPSYIWKGVLDKSNTILPLLESQATLFLRRSIDLCFGFPLLEKKNKLNKVYNVSLENTCLSLLTVAECIRFITGNSDSLVWKNTKVWKLIFTLDPRKPCRITLFQQDYLHLTISNVKGKRKCAFNIFWRKKNTSLKEEKR